MFCGFCGSQVNPGATFCPNCGKKVDGGTSSQKSGKTIKNPAVNSGVVHKSPAQPKIGKQQVANFGLWVVLIGVYILTAFALVFAFGYEGCIKVTSGFDRDVSQTLSLMDVMKYLYTEYYGFAPTVSSTIISVTLYALLYSLPFISLLMLIGTIAGNSKLTWHTAWSILNVVAAAILAVAMPLILRLVPHVVNIIGAEVSIMAQDIGSISCILLYVFAGIILALVIVSYILLLALLRRKKNEKAHTDIQ